jgi:hypothetical protein
MERNGDRSTQFVSPLIRSSLDPVAIGRMIRVYFLGNPGERDAILQTNHFKQKNY